MIMLRLNQISPKCVQHNAYNLETCANNLVGWKIRIAVSMHAKTPNTNLIATIINANATVLTSIKESMISTEVMNAMLIAIASPVTVIAMLPAAALYLHKKPA